MTTFIVIGSVFVVGYAVLFAALINVSSGTLNDSVTAANAFNQLSSSTTTLDNGLTSFESATSTCDGNLTCLTKLDAATASDFNTFDSQLAATPVPASAAADKAKLSADGATVANDFTKLSQSTTGTQYASTVGSIHLQQALDAFTSDDQALANQLQSSY